MQPCPGYLALCDSLGGAAPHCSAGPEARSDKQSLLAGTAAGRTGSGRLVGPAVDGWSDRQWTARRTGWSDRQQTGSSRTGSSISEKVLIALAHPPISELIWVDQSKRSCGSVHWQKKAAAASSSSSPEIAAGHSRDPNTAA
jgi:hypothetical protein